MAVAYTKVGSNVGVYCLCILNIQFLSFACYNLHYQDAGASSRRCRALLHHLPLQISLFSLLPWSHRTRHVVIRRHCWPSPRKVHIGQRCSIRQVKCPIVRPDIHTVLGGLAQGEHHTRAKNADERWRAGEG